jgi:hypothetical protein
MDIPETLDGIVHLFKRKSVTARVETPFIAEIQHDKITAEFSRLKSVRDRTGRLISGYQLRA